MKLTPIPETVYRAGRDPRLTPAQVRVYLVLWRELDVRGFQAVKLARLVNLARLPRRSSASYALRALVNAGYLERGPKFCEPGGQCFVTYRLLNGESPAQPVDAPRTPRLVGG